MMSSLFSKSPDPTIAANASAGPYPWAGAIKLARRSLIVLGLALCACLPPAGFAQSPPQVMGVVQARQSALDDQLILIDVRRPEEWAETGIADVATEIDMRSPEFLKRVTDFRAANPDKAIAFICAVGSRSAGLANWFARRGFDNIVDVRAGMVGRNGWLENRLPLRRAPGAHPSER